uniref:Uncharacterized protein n=1 Tax=Alexandrium monilatum TaxID=311494 RepID=A0A7S4W1R1_9DINO
MNPTRPRSRSAPPRGRAVGEEGGDSANEPGAEALLRSQLLAAERRAAELEAAAAQLRERLERQEELARDADRRAEEERQRREDAEGEAAEHRDDIAEQACDQAQLETEVDRLEHQREQLRGELAKAKADLGFVERKFKDAERCLADREQLARRPATLLAAKERKNKQLLKQVEEKAQTIGALREQLAQARSAQKRSQDAAPGESHDLLRRQLSAAQRDQAFSEEKCWRLEEALEERDRAVEEAEAEAQRLAGCLEEEEERRLALEKRLAQAEEAAAAVAAPLAEAPDVLAASVVGGKDRGAAGAPAELEALRAQLEELEALRPQLAQARAAQGHAEAQAQQLQQARAGQDDELARVRDELQAATQLLVEFEAAATGLRQQLEEVLSARVEPEAVGQDAVAALERRMGATSRRCQELEAAGRKSLVELEERDARIEEQGREVRRLRRRAAELEALLDRRPAEARSLQRRSHGDASAEKLSQSSRELRGLGQRRPREERPRVDACMARAGSTAGSRRCWRGQGGAVLAGVPAEDLGDQVPVEAAPASGSVDASDSESWSRGSWSGRSLQWSGRTYHRADEAFWGRGTWWYEPSAHAAAWSSDAWVK